METEPGIGTSESATVAQALSSLKRDGCNILLVGESGPSVHESACRRLLGDSSEDAKYRISVTTDPTECARSTGSDRSPDRTIEYVDGRSSAEGDGGNAEDGPDGRDVTRTTMLGALGTSLVEVINEFEADADLDPSELRVCVDSVGTLLDEHDTENVFRLLHVMATRIKQAGGMGHYHVPVERDHETVRLFEPLFDAVVEIRSGSDGAEHRWHLRDRRASSDWIPL